MVPKDLADQRRNESQRPAVNQWVDCVDNNLVHVVGRRCVHDIRLSVKGSPGVRLDHALDPSYNIRLLLLKSCL